MLAVSLLIADLTITRPCAVLIVATTLHINTSSRVNSQNCISYPNNNPNLHSFPINLTNPVDPKPCVQRDVVVWAWCSVAQSIGVSRHYLLWLTVYKLGLIVVTVRQMSHLNAACHGLSSCYGAMFTWVTTLIRQYQRDESQLHVEAIQRWSRYVACELEL